MNGYTLITHNVYDADHHLIATVEPFSKATGLVSVTFSAYVTPEETGPCEVTLPLSCLTALIEALGATAQESSATR